jgi:hypothetical protein
MLLNVMLAPELTPVTAPDSVTTFPDTETTERPAGMPAPETGMFGTIPVTVAMVSVVAPFGEEAAVVSIAVGDKVANEPNE